MGKLHPGTTLTPSVHVLLGDAPLPGRYDKRKLLANGDKWEHEIARNLASEHVYR